VAGAGEQPGGVKDPAVAIELVLVVGAVTDADRSAVGVAGPAVEFPFRGWVAAVEGEQDREAGPVQAAGVEQPGVEVAGFGVLADAEKGADADAGVAGPGIAVVPVADPAGVFGERGCRRRDRRTRRGVGQQPQGEQAAGHRVAVREVAVDVGTPALPAVFVGLQCRPGHLGVDVGQRFAVGDTQREGDGLTRQDTHPQGSSGLEAERRRCAQRERGGRPAAHDDVAAVLDARRPVVLAEAGIELDHGVNRAAGGGESAHQQAGRQQPAADVGDHPLGQGELPARRVPGCLKGGGVGSVAAGDDRGRSGRAHAEGARRRPADQAAEHGLAVEAGDAQPVDGAVGADKCRGTGVTEQPVVLDRPHVSGPRAACRGRCRR
jgi:hypothetical protein